MKKINLAALALLSINPALALSSENLEEKISVIENSLGIKVDLTADFEAELSGKVGPSSHNLHIGRDCRLSVSYDSKTKTMTSTVWADFEANASNQYSNEKTWEIGMDTVYETGMSSVRMQKNGKSVLAQFTSFDHFSLRFTTDFVEQKPVSFSSSKLFPVVSCVINSEYTFRK